MKLVDVCESAEAELNRNLHQKEVEFLKWLCRRHDEEQKTDKVNA